MRSEASLLLAALFVLLAGCVDDTLGSGPAPDAFLPPAALGWGDAGPAEGALHDSPPWAVAVLGSDYASSSLSIVARKGATLFRESVLHSGSAAPGLSVALSGDVVLPRAHDPHNRIVLIDRYPNSVLSFLDPVDFSVMDQLSVATGFAANPRDFLWLSESKAYVTRYERNARAGAGDFDGGDDLLVVDPDALAIVGRIPLGDQADTTANPGLQARPDQMAWAGGLVWVTLNHLTDDFKGAGEGLVVAIDPATDEIVHRLALPGLANCGGIVSVAERQALYLSCSGLFVAGEEEQRSRSGLARVDLSVSPPEAAVLRSAATGSGQPFGFELDVARGRWLFAVRFGDLEAEIPDRLVAVELDTGEEELVYEASSAFGLGGLLVDEAYGVLYVGDAAPESPAVHVYRVTEGGFTPAGSLDSHPRTGLPPRQIRFY